ncbi:MAG: CBS domain-containing protein [Candidatus Nezhaarchaeota archaeon]|nr:CBS domain-containing protein [Candidatus Nezhaarchaeota archaeon]MCX8142019.1 CBS domain-containing protein [Candidatus Nezhaarchaeota archaeon]MDW8050200.1 CBS domain-containing protein [Nitrososphaerota archaeon]
MPDVKVSDVMSTDPVTVSAEDSAVKAAILMDKHGVGCVIVVDGQRRPIGIVTERDLVSRVMARGLKGDEVTCREVMSSPLITIDPQAPLVSAMSKMARHKVRRLIVLDRGRLVGIVTERDILKVAPALIEILASKSEVEESYVKEVQVGECEICGVWSEDLREVNGHFICEECRSEYVARE